MVLAHVDWRQAVGIRPAHVEGKLRVPSDPEIHVVPKEARAAADDVPPLSATSTSFAAPLELPDFKHRLTSIWPSLRVTLHHALPKCHWSTATSRVPKTTLYPKAVYMGKPQRQPMRLTMQASEVLLMQVRCMWWKINVSCRAYFTCESSLLRRRRNVLLSSATSSRYIILACMDNPTTR